MIKMMAIAGGATKKLALTNYGMPREKGAWEIDHSNPVSRGGTNYLRNLVPACISCNRSKEDGSKINAIDNCSNCLDIVDIS